MEHEEQNIRHKVRAWENGGRVYNSDQLWASLAYPLQRPTRPAAFYLAAAALVLSGALVIYSLGETQRRAFELRMMEVELLLKQVEATPRQATIVQPEEVACAVIEEPARHRVLKKTRTPAIQQASLMKVEKAVVEPVATTQPNQVVAVPAEKLPEQQEVKPSPRIVLGSSISAAPQPTSTRSRLSLRLFKGEADQEENSKSATPVVTLASINN